MRKPLSLLAAMAIFIGMGLVAPAAAVAVEKAPTIKRAWIAADVGMVGILDAGDVLKIRFSRPVVVTDVTSFGIEMTGSNGSFMRLENEVFPYGMNYTLRGTTLTIRVNLIPEEYSPEDPPMLTYPITLASGWEWSEKVFYNIEGKNGLAINVVGDVLID